MYRERDIVKINYALYGTMRDIRAHDHHPVCDHLKNSNDINGRMLKLKLKKNKKTLVHDIILCI